MKTNFYFTILSLLILSCSGALNAQSKPKLLTDEEKEQLNTSNSIEEAMEKPILVQALYLNYAQLDEMPKEIENFENLIVLGVSANNIKEIPLFIFDLKELQALGLSHNQITEIPEEIANLKNLTSFKCWNNNISNIPVALLSLPYIQTIELKGNPIPKEEKKRLQKAYPNIKFVF